MSRFKNTILISAGTLSILSVTAQSQEKGSIPVGTFELTPTLNVSLQKDSNVARSNTDKIDSWVTVLNPQLVLGKQMGENSLRVGVNASKGIYHSSDADDYDDYQAFINGEFEFDRRNRIAASLVHKSGHDARGDVYSSGAGAALTVLDLFTSNTLDATYSYGASTATANVDFNLGLRDIDYDIDVLDFNPTRLRDRKEEKLGSTFYYQIGPTIDLTLDANYLVTDYDGDITEIASFDSKTKSVLVGAQWESSAATSGFAKIGYQKRDFDDISRNGYSGLEWEAGIAWNPIERAIFEFSTANDTQETNGQGNFIQRKVYVADWRHNWIDRVSTSTSIRYSDDSYEGGTLPRNDKTKEYRTTVDYQFRRWLKLTSSISYFDRNSTATIGDFDYNRSLFSVAAQISL